MADSSSMGRWQAEVFEDPAEGSGVGVSVKVCSSLTEAVLYVAATMGNPWASGWRIVGDGGTISDTSSGWAVLSPPDHD